MCAGAGVFQEWALSPLELVLQMAVSHGGLRNRGQCDVTINFPQVSNISALNVIAFSSALTHLSFFTFFLTFYFVFKSKIILEHFKRQYQNMDIL